MTTPLSPKPRKRNLLLWTGLCIGLIIAGIGIGLLSLPGILSADWMKPRILGVVKPLIAPGSLSVDKFQFGWDQPLVMSGFQIRDQDGTVVIDSKTVKLSRTLWQLIEDPDDMGTLSLEEAVIDIKREPDGTINLIRALGSLIKPNAGRDFAIEIRKSTLKVMTPENWSNCVGHRPGGCYGRAQTVSYPA